MRGYQLNDDDVLRRTVINKLLCHTLIRKTEIAQEFGITFDDYFSAELAHLETVAADGLVALNRDEIRVTWLGRIFIRNIAMVFDAYLEKQKLDSRPLFSKTL
jgi:oxygen-independent coproporphyrinogen-3 oxidase